MPFDNIKRITATTVSSKYYFVDAQVWIYALQGDTALAWWQKEYVDFFYNIIECDLEPKPKIVMPVLLFSEILNTWLTKIALKDYKIENQIVDSEFVFKRDYRPTPHYKENYEKICDDILSLKSSLIFINDSSIVSDNPIYIKSSIEPFDFNDYLYYILCKEFQKSHPISILTNDGDFQVSDIPIIINNRALIKLNEK